MELISSAQNAVFKHVHKLVRTRRERVKTQQTLLDGTHLLAAWLDADRAVLRIFVSEQGLARQEVQQLLARSMAPVVQLSAPLFAELSELPSASGILALVEIPAAVPAIKSGFILALDGVQDPGNVGAILRTAQAAGVDQVWLSAECADIWSPKVLRAGMGAQTVLTMIDHADLPRLLAQFDGAIAATTLDGAVDLYSAPLQGALALVLGSEGAGVSVAVLNMATVKVKIPMMDGIESLNVGHAAAICLYEVRRQNAVGISS